MGCGPALNARLAGVAVGLGAGPLAVHRYPELVGLVAVGDRSRRVGDRPHRAEAIGVVDQHARPLHGVGHAKAIDVLAGPVVQHDGEAAVDVVHQGGGDRGHGLRVTHAIAVVGVGAGGGFRGAATANSCCSWPAPASNPPTNEPEDSQRDSAERQPCEAGDQSGYQPATDPFQERHADYGRTVKANQTTHAVIV